MNAQETKLPQPMLPRGLAGRIIAWMMPIGHNSIYKRVSKVLNLQQLVIEEEISLRDFKEYRAVLKPREPG